MYKYLLLGIIIGILLTYFIVEIKTRCIIKNDTRTLLNNIIQKLMRQSARWSTAAEQDNSPMISVLHASYGAGYLWALKDIASNTDIKIATGEDIDTLENNIVAVLDKSTTNAIRICPQYGPVSTYLSRLGKE
mgnify:CR=1 FL=1|jgi:hypothetical protein|tara:strand:+ start:138 stop:536 length:399 start_codon:yes stop_codon:yes gene_type:complete